VIDHRIEGLPDQRTNLLRGEPVFARQSSVLLQALERGNA
jgi:hypothetical protein